MAEPKKPQPIAIGLQPANENAPNEAGVIDAGHSISLQPPIPTELEILQPLIKALAELAANDLCATTLCSGEP